jgi:hypothetical protein
MLIDVTHRGFRSGYESDQLPYSKAAAHRAVRITIGQELKTRYEATRDLPHEMTIILMRFSGESRAAIDWGRWHLGSKHFATLLAASAADRLR